MKLIRSDGEFEIEFMILVERDGSGGTKVSMLRLWN